MFLSTNWRSNIISSHQVSDVMNLKAYTTKKEITFPKPHQGIINTIQDVLKDFWVHGICVFGSYPQWRGWIYSDYDFTIVCDKLPLDINERESYSPKIKDELRARWISEICAFNLYNTNEILSAVQKRSWLPATMQKGFWIIQDEKWAMEKVFIEDSGIKKIGNFIWNWIQSENPIRIEELSERYAKVASQLLEYPEIAKFYAYESERMKSVHTIYSRDNIFPTRAEISDLPIERNAELMALEIWAMQTKDEWQLPWTADTHNEVSLELEGKWFLQDALMHSYLSVRTLILNILWSNQIYPLDWEVTQIFLRDMNWKVDKKVTEMIRQLCYKSEQTLGRCWYISFDLKEDWTGLFFDQKEELWLQLLIKGLRQLYKILKWESQITWSIQNGIFIPNWNIWVVYNRNTEQLNEVIKWRVLTIILPEEITWASIRPLWAIRVANLIWMKWSLVHTPREWDLSKHIFY